MANKGYALFQSKRDKAQQLLEDAGLDQWTQRQYNLRQSQNDFDNYLSSGNYTTENNQKFRDMATKAVADLDNEMKQYGKSSNEYKLLNSYKNYYSNALPNFDRMDVGANMRDYLSYDTYTNKFNNWHSEEDYNAQKSYIDQQRQALQTEMDAIEDQTSADYQSLKSWMDQYDMLSEALEERNSYDRQFQDIADYTAYERSSDYKNTIQAKQTLQQAQEQLKDLEAQIKPLEMKFNGYTDLSSLAGTDAEEYQQLADLRQQYAKQQKNVLDLTSEVAGMEKWQKDAAIANYYAQYGADADYQQILDDLIEARNKAEEGSEDWAKIDLQIRALAGENENGLNDNGQYDDSTLYGRAVMRDFDMEAAQKRMDEIDQELKDLGVSENRFWGMVTNAENNVGVDAAGMVYTDESRAGESDPRVMALRQEKTELTRKMNSAEKFQEKDAAEKAFSNLSEEEHQALQEEGMKHLTQKGNTYYRDIGVSAEEGSGVLDNFRYLEDTEKLDALPEKYKYYADHAKEIRNMLVEALGAEALGKDIGYTVDDVLRLYEGDINLISGLLSSQDISNMESDFLRWNRQVFGVGTQAGLNQFATGMRQVFSDDYIEPNKTAYKAQFTREDLKRYGDEQVANGANVSQMLFDTTQTTANMLPMIVSSYLMSAAGAPEVAGAIVGATLMGMSSAGNTYQQALAEGWDKTDAKAYATILGAAEGAMQYLIGGISALGGVGEEQLLRAATGINNAAIRFAAETGIHILSETTEELAQNRLQRYLDYKLGASDNPDWYSWDDDDWYTVIVTALSTGALEGPSTAINLSRSVKLGEQLSGQRAITSKATTQSAQARNATIAEIGKAMQGQEALKETLLTIGTSADMEGTNAYELATRLESGKAAMNAANLGALYSEIVSEYVAKNGKIGYDTATAAIIGGAVKYHELAGAKTAVEAANAQAAEVRKANPGAEVLDLNTSEMVKLGATQAAASEFSPIINKVLSGTDLTSAEMDKLLGDSRAAQAARVLLGQQSGDPNTIQQLRLSLTRGNAEGAREVIQNQIQEAKDAKKLRKAADKAAVEQAAVDAANQAEVSIAARNADLVPASTVKAVQKADTAVENAKARQSQIERMSYKELGNAQALGLTDTAIDAGAYTELSKQMNALNQQAEKLAAVKFPSAEQRTQLADIRQQQAALKAQMVALDSDMRSGVVAKAAAKSTAAAPAQTATGTDADVANIPTMGEVTRAQFVKDFLEANPNATAEQANVQFDEYAAMTGGVKKGNVENGQTTAEKEKVKPNRREKLTGKVEYWQGGAVPGAGSTEYGAVTEAEAEQLLGKTELDFVKNVLSKVANVTLIKSVNGVGANGIFFNNGRLYLDVNAHEEYGQRSIVLVAAHELTHFIRAYNDAAYGKLRDFVTAELVKNGQSLEDLIKREQDNYAAANPGKELSRDKAIEEVVANSCETMLTDGEAIRRFAEQNPAEAKTILDWLMDFFQKISDAFNELVAIHPEAKAMQQNIDELRGIWLNALASADENAAKSAIDRLSEGDQKIVESLGQDAKVQVDNNGDMTLAQSEDGKKIAFSMKTYEDSGKHKLIQALKENGHTQEEIDAVVENIEATGDFLVKLAQQFSDSHGYNNLKNNLWAEITTNLKTGKQAISTLVNNGDYPVNLDLQLICKKRAAYMRMLTRLIDDGVFEKVNFKGGAIADLNAVLRDGGFETACLGCFVESRRLQLQAWAETIVEEWNAEVNKRNPQAGDFNFAKGGNALSNMEIAGLITELENAGEKNDKGNLNLGKGAVKEKMGRLLDKVPSLVQHLTVADLLTPQGMSTLRSYDQNLFSLVKQRYGAASPKIVQDFNAYNSEIADLSFKFVKEMIGESVKGSGKYIAQAKKTVKQRIGESKADYNKRVETEAMRKYLYDIGGVRIQSFSDFMIENVFDNLQIIADLSAREFPLHGYSKEAIFLRLFGMTGGKFNGSLIAHVEESMGKEYAGLLPAEEAKDGRGILVEVDGKMYAICFDDYARHVATGSFIQSIGMKDIVALQLDPRYSKNVGSITIGVSDKQILAMLDSPYFRMIIPYHASGMIAEFARLVGVSSYNDYTDYQTTKVNKCFDMNGNPAEGFWKSDGTKIEIDTHFDFNEAVQRLGDARAAADEYLEWCRQRHPVYDGKKIVGYATFTPKFSDSPYGTDFTKHENYYKLLEDFNSYDSVDEASALQGAVTMTFPSEDTRLTAEQMAAYKQALRSTGLFTEKEIEKYAKKADMTFQELIAEEIGNRAEYESRQAKVWDETVDKAEKMLLEKYSREPTAKTEMRDSSIENSAEEGYNSPTLQEEAGENAVGSESGRVRTGSEVQGETQTEVSKDVGRGVSEGLGEENRRQTWGELDPAEREAITSAVVPFLEKNMTWEGKEIRSDFQSDEDFLEFLYDRAYQPSDENGIVFENEAGYFVKNPSALFDLINETKKTETLGKSRENRSEGMIAQTTQDVKSIDEGTQHGPQYSLRDNDESNPYPPDTLEHDLLNLAREGDAEAISKWLNQKMNEREDKLENAKMRAPIIPTRSFVPKVSEQEKAALDKTLNAALDKYGPMRPSEKSNGFVLPAKNQAGQNLRRGLQNIGSAKQITKEAQDQLERFAFTDVAATYVPDSNEKDIKAAKTQIQDLGLDRAKAYFSGVADSTKAPSTQDIALGEQLLIETSANGDMRGFLDVLSSVCEMSTQIGKSLQAFRMLKQSGPIGELYYVQKAVSRLNKKLEDKIERGKANTITVKDELSKAVLMAPDAETREKAMDALIADIASQVPVTLKDKWDSWRYLAMLGNARTHIRNVIGNAVFVPLRYAKDLMAAGGELIATQAGWMEEGDRTKALAVSRELRDFAASDADVYKKELQGNGKYNPAQEIMNARRVLPGFLDTLSRKNGDFLEAEDWLFLRAAYTRSLTQALAHTGYTVEELQTTVEGKRALNNARRLAIEEAQKATYRDFSAVAATLNRIKKLEGKSKFAGVLLEGVLPFTKTPINILKRGVEYSPLGIASAIGTAVQGARNGNLNVAQFIDELSAGLTGTAVAALGWLLARMGILRGKKKDEKEEGFEKLQGYQDYSIQLGDVSFTIDWAAPTALPLFTGATIVELMENSEDLQWKDAWNAMMMIAEPMMSLSMLDGLNNVLSSASYAGENEKLATVATSALTSYLGQAIPTLGGQFARTIDGTRRSTYVDKNSPLPAGMQRFIQASVQNKIPIWESQKAPYIDAWGREDNASSKLLGAFENFLSPAYINMVNTTDVDQTLQELYASTKDGSILPEAPGKYFSVNGERKDLTADEYVSYAKDVGSTKYTLLTQLFSDPRYLALSDTQKAKAISYIYKYATAAGKYHVDQNFDIHGQGKWIEEAEAMQNETLRFNRIWEQIEKGLKD